MTEQLTNLWPAPLATQPLNATVTVPGSKSLSNRYLILAALGSKPVTLIGLLRSRDTDLMMAHSKPSVSAATWIPQPTPP